MADRCVVLGGGLSPAPIARATGLAVLDMPVSPTRCLADVLSSRLDESFQLPEGVRPIVLRSEGMPIARRLPEGLELLTEQRRYRGPAGAVRDVCGEGDPDAWIAVIEGNRYFGESLSPVVARATGDADVVVGANPDRTPSGVYLLRRRVIEMTPRLGFLDLKEQLLKKLIAAGGRAVSANLHGMGVFAVRTRLDLLQAVERESVRERSRRATLYARRVVAAQKWTSVVEPGATVDPDSVLVESVVMAGSDIGPGAVVVRSLVCPGAVIRPGEELVDRVVTSHSKTCAREESTTRVGRPVSAGAPVPNGRSRFELVRRTFLRL